jgi:hypothetical protein
MSLIASGMPQSGDASPEAIRRSAASACSSASRTHTVMKALSWGSIAAIRSRHARVSSLDETLRDESNSRASVIVSLLSSDAIN